MLRASTRVRVPDCSPENYADSPAGHGRAPFSWGCKRDRRSADVHVGVACSLGAGDGVRDRWADATFRQRLGGCPGRGAWCGWPGQCISTVGCFHLRTRCDPQCRVASRGASLTLTPLTGSLSAPRKKEKSIQPSESAPLGAGGPRHVDRRPPAAAAKCVAWWRSRGAGGAFLPRPGGRPQANGPQPEAQLPRWATGSASKAISTPRSKSPKPNDVVRDEGQKNGKF